MGADDESFLDLLDTSEGGYDLDELCGQVEKILSTSTTSKEQRKSAAVTTKPQQPEERESIGSHRKREQEEQQRPAEQKPVKEKKRVEYPEPLRQLPAPDDAMEEVVKSSSSSGRAKRPRIQLPDERETTIRASSSKSATRIFKFRVGAADDEVRMQRKLRFSGADHHRHEKSSGNKRGGGEVYDVRARRAARYGTTAATASVAPREEGTKRRATAAASGGADAGTLKRLGVPMKSRKDLP